MASRGVQKVLHEQFAEEMRKNFEFYAALVATLVADLRHDTVSDFDFDADNIPSAQLLRRPFVAVAATSIMWSMLGLSTWTSGAHFPSSYSGSPSFSEAYAIRTHINRIIEVARGG